MIVAVVLVEAVAVGGHGRDHGRRDGRDSPVPVVEKYRLYVRVETKNKQKQGTGESFLKSFLCIVLRITPL